MTHHRRQNADKMRAKVGCYIVRKRPKVPIARMQQVPPRSRAIHILARRASKEGLLRVKDIDGQFAGTSVERADPKSSKRWVEKEPNLPERLIDSGLLSVNDVPRPLRSFLRITR